MLWLSQDNGTKWQCVYIFNNSILISNLPFKFLDSVMLKLVLAISILLIASARMCVRACVCVWH